MPNQFEYKLFQFQLSYEKKVESKLSSNQQYIYDLPDFFINYLKIRSKNLPGTRQLSHCSNSNGSNLKTYQSCYYDLVVKSYFAFITRQRVQISNCKVRVLHPFIHNFQVLNVRDDGSQLLPHSLLLLHLLLLVPLQGDSPVEHILVHVQNSQLDVGNQ